ncbi:hypothetical protein [Nocardia wallacei]|uniref:hypothetical protein n=1 Tax=Nocardia wallacei TaxID=480035 RepID=UPI002456FFB6|nr:hypothetical protein [Nocardia wallacei]
MVNYAPPSFPAGVMLTVVRNGTANTRNWEGDFEGDDATHSVGPCDLKWLTDTEDNTSGELLVLVGQVTAPHGSDVLEGDRIRFPDGREFVIDGQVREVPNPFTGWVTGVRFRIARDGASGIRRN